MREKCLKCFRPLTSCYCTDITPVSSGIFFLFLMHPKEAYHQHTGTGRLASLSLPQSEIIVGIDFSHNHQVLRYLADSRYYPILLYPGAQASTAKQLAQAHSIPDNKQLLVIVLDATWFFAKKMLRLSPNLQTLPRITFEGTYQSQYQFKKQPAPECVSTIEACYYLIKELQQADLASSDCDPEPLMRVFKKMVNFQLRSEQERILSGRPGNHAYDNKRSFFL